MRGNKPRITISDEIFDTTCSVCKTNNGVKEVLFNCGTYGTGIVLCNDCRKRLIKLLVMTTDF